MTTDTLYDSDFLTWTERQADALRQAARQGSNLPIDWENLAEEIESVGNSERSETRSLVSHIVSHLLKLAYSPAMNPRVKWESEIAFARDVLERRLDASPSLRPKLDEYVATEIPRARRSAARDLLAFGEQDAAALVRRADLTVSGKDVLDQEFFLPGTSFLRGE